eukprot:GFUD01045103.1.p1 GENE.GFUD01045103.1~~GFUD01045103.1.p1  ORF type:complete len:493 (+),score=170.87 GFUD01045103.1:55-1533(+)
MAVVEPQTNPNWTEFPLTHRTPFTLILLYCSPMDVLSCRATCSTWHSWFCSSSSIWSKYYSSIRSSVPDLCGYRLEKLMDVPFEGEAAALTLSIKLDRVLNSESILPTMNHDTMVLVKTLEKSVPVLGPPAIFVRLKVNHPVVTKIVAESICRYLGSVLVDKKDIEREEVRRVVFRNMHRQNWAYVDFGQQRKQPLTLVDVDTSGSLVLEGGSESRFHAENDRLEEALRLSLGARGDELSGKMGEKRKRFKEELEERKAKRRKVDDMKKEEDLLEEIEENQNLEDDSEGGEIPEVPKLIYAAEEMAHSEFPTILELLCIDQPVVKDLLVTRCQIDSSLVVPQFDEFLHYPSLLESNKLVVGCDCDGKVASVRPANFSQSGGEVLGYIETPNIVPRDGQQVVFWGGKDIRGKWPQFAKQLDRLDQSLAAPAGQKKHVGSKLNLPVAVARPAASGQEPGEENTQQNGVAGPSSSSSVGDLMAFLAARGVSVQKK